MADTWATQNFDTHTAGDGFGGARFVMSRDGTPLDLTGAVLIVEFRNESPEGALLHIATEGNGLTVNDAAAGDFQIEPFSLDGWPGGQHPWGCQIQLAGATYPHHFIKGVLPIAEEIVRTA